MALNVILSTETLKSRDVTFVNSKVSNIHLLIYIFIYYITFIHWLATWFPQFFKQSDLLIESPPGFARRAPLYIKVF